MRSLKPQLIKHFTPTVAKPIQHLEKKKKNNWEKWNESSEKWHRNKCGFSVPYDFRSFLSWTFFFRLFNLVGHNFCELLGAVTVIFFDKVQCFFFCSSLFAVVQPHRSILRAKRIQITVTEFTAARKKPHFQFGKKKNISYKQRTLND